MKPLDFVIGVDAAAIIGVGLLDVVGKMELGGCGSGNVVNGPSVGATTGDDDRSEVSDSDVDVAIPDGRDFSEVIADVLPPEVDSVLTLMTVKLSSSNEEDVSLEELVVGKLSEVVSVEGGTVELVGLLTESGVAEEYEDSGVEEEYEDERLVSGPMYIDVYAASEEPGAGASEDVPFTSSTPSIENRLAEASQQLVPPLSSGRFASQQ